MTQGKYAIRSQRFGNNSQSRKTSAWYYGLGLLVFVAGFLVAAAFFYRGVKGLPEAIINAYDLDRLTQVVVPGSAEITLSRTGAYAVYYEHQSVVNGMVFATNEAPLPLDCSLVRNATGDRVLLVPDYVATNRYATMQNRRVGTLFMSTTVAEPGRYTFSCKHAVGSDQPEVVLAFGQNLFWELMLAVAKTAGFVLGSLLILSAASMLALIILVVVAVKRGRSNA